MLLLVTIALVLVAAVTLLIGIISDNLALIFISIGASAVAAIVLAVLSQMSRRKGKGAAEAVPAVAADSSTPAAPPAPEPTAATVVADEPTTTMPAVSAPAASLDLPIADYDSLRVNEILPRLDDLDLDELEAVAQHEETHKNRSTVLNRIDARMDVLEAEEAGGTVDEPADDETVDDAVAAIEEVGQPVQLDDEVEEAEDEDESGDDGFPIPGYDDLSESALIPLLDDLDADQLETVADREEAGQNRDGVLDAIDDRLDILEGIVPAASAKPASAAKKTGVAKKTPAKKAAAAPRKVAAAPAKRAPAKRAPVKKAAAPAAKATKSTTKSTTKAPAKAAAPARKAPARATATPAPARKSAAVKKAAPVKKATAAKKATKR